MTDAEAPKRRGPGRPSSKPPVPVLKVSGIVQEPIDAGNAIEFVFSDPLVFKTLFIYFKNLKSRDIHIRFRATDITFFTRDHTKMSKVISHIDCRNVNWYYCRKEQWIGLNREHAEKMFTNIDKTFFKITMVYREDDPDYLCFIFKDSELSKECHYKIDIAIIEHDDELFNAENDIPSAENAFQLYPVQFTLNSKQFKKTISDASSYSEIINIEKTPGYPLQITYNKVNITYREVYMDPDKIKLVSNISTGQNFKCKIRLSNIKSLASSMVTDNVSIMASDKHDVLLRSVIDEKILIIYTFVTSNT
jgi:hypothetical protein